MLVQQRAVVVEFGAGRQRTSAIRDPAAIPRKERAAIRTGAPSEAAHVGAIARHGVDLHVAVADAGKRDEAVRRNRSLRIVTSRRRERLQVGPIGIPTIDVVAFVNRPDVAALVAWLRRTRVAGAVRRREQYRRGAGIEITARRSPFAGAHAPHVTAVNLHREDLITGIAVARGLKDEAGAIRREVGLGILPA